MRWQLLSRYGRTDGIGGFCTPPLAAWHGMAWPLTDLLRFSCLLQDIYCLGATQWSTLAVPESTEEFEKLTHSFLTIALGASIRSTSHADSKLGNSMVSGALATLHADNSAASMADTLLAALTDGLVVALRDEPKSQDPTLLFERCNELLGALAQVGMDKNMLSKALIEPIIAALLDSAATGSQSRAAAALMASLLEQYPPAGDTGREGAVEGSIAQIAQLRVHESAAERLEELLR
jgi:hypothetical protein